MSQIYFEKVKFDIVYEKYACLVFRTAYNFLLNKEDAEDVVQEVFVKYFKHNKNFKDNNHEKAWILTVTSNLCKNILRLKSRKNIQLDEEIKISENGFENSVNQHLDLKNTMAQLTPNQRLVIHFYYYEQIPIKSIAKIMKTNENTVKSHLFRAKSKMKQFLEKE